MDNLFKKLGINVVNSNLYDVAFLHSSYTNEKNSKEDYERLEFLGDAVLELVVSDYLYNNYHLVEGEMTKARANYVCEKALSTYALEFNLQEYIKLGNGELKAGGLLKPTILADIFEALMGAIYLDLGFETVKKIIITIIKPYIDKQSNFLEDYKSKLQELVQTEKRTVEYKLVDESGPAHNKSFTLEVVISGIKYGSGTGASKKIAEQNAAKEALEKLAL